jgi:hypothetical protein
MPALLAIAWFFAAGQQLPRSSLQLGGGAAGGLRTDTGGWEVFAAGEIPWAQHWSLRLEVHHGWDPANHVDYETALSFGAIGTLTPGPELTLFAGLGLGLADFRFGFPALPGCGPYGEECDDVFVERAGLAPIGWVGLRLGGPSFAFELSGAAEYFRVRGVDEAMVHLRLGLVFGLPRSE